MSLSFVFENAIKYGGIRKPCAFCGVAPDNLLGVAQAMFRIKICGLTDPEDLRKAADAGADAVGLNFYSASRRALCANDRKGLDASDPRVQRVGVFVDADLAEITHHVRDWKLDAVQLHGNESPEFQKALQIHLSGLGIPWVRAYRLGKETLAEVRGHWQAAQHLGATPDAVLIDAATDGSFGGAGELADWHLLIENRAIFGNCPVILAGGLTPRNVADAIGSVRPAGVDVASGVEVKNTQKTRPRKDPKSMLDFCRQAKSAFERLVGPDR